MATKKLVGKKVVGKKVVGKKIEKLEKVEKKKVKVPVRPSEKARTNTPLYVPPRTLTAEGWRRSIVKKHGRKKVKK